MTRTIRRMRAMSVCFCGMHAVWYFLSGAGPSRASCGKKGFPGVYGRFQVHPDSPKEQPKLEPCVEMDCRMRKQ